MDDDPIPVSARPSLRGRLALLGCAVASLAASALVGISDNPPGLLLAFLASLCVVLALTLGWHHPRRHLFLFVGSLLAFVVAAALHNLLEAAAARVTAPSLQAAAEALGVAFFLAAIFLCPAGLAVAAIGGLATLVRRRLRP